jgi:hypothetical protein
VLHLLALVDCNGSTYSCQFVDKLWLHAIHLVSCNWERLSYQWIRCRALARELSTRTCFGLSTSVIAKEYNIGCMSSKQCVSTCFQNPNSTTACSQTTTTMCTSTLVITTSGRCGYNVPPNLKYSPLSSCVCTLMCLSRSLTLRVALLLVTIRALLLKPATSLLFQLPYRTTDHLPTLQACSSICTTLCIVFGQLEHQKRGITVPENQHD